MAIKNFEFYHGAVLAKILRKDMATSLKLVETNTKEHWSTYIINDEIALYISYRTGKPNKNKTRLTWYFNLNKNHLKELEDFIHKDLKFALICLSDNDEICKSEICLLEKEDILELIDINSEFVQTITISLEKNQRKFRVHGTLSEIKGEKKINKCLIDNVEIPA